MMVYGRRIAASTVARMLQRQVEVRRENSDRATRSTISLEHHRPSELSGEDVAAG